MGDSSRTTSVHGLIRHMLAVSGMTAADVSRAMGKTSGYLAVMLHNETTPRMDLFVKIAETCGYHVEVHGPQYVEEFELHTEDGELIAEMTQSFDDLDELSRMDDEAHRLWMDTGRAELIDSLIAYLEGLKAQQQ